MHLRPPRTIWLYGLAAALVVLAVPAIGELRCLPNWRSICTLGFSPDGQMLLAGLYDGRSYNEDFHYLLSNVGQTVALYDARTGKQAGNLVQLRNAGPYLGIPSTPLGRFLAFSPDGTTLAIAGWDGTVQLWDWQAKELSQTLRSQLQRFRAVTFSSQGRHLIAGGRSGLWIWDTQSPGAGSFVDSNCSAREIASARESNLVAIADRHCPWVEVLDCDSGKKTRIDLGKSNGALAVSFSPDGRSLAIGGTESVLIWNLSNETKQFEVVSHWAQDIAFSPESGFKKLVD